MNIGYVEYLSYAILSFLQVFDRLQPLGVCLCHERTNKVVTAVGGHFNDALVNALKAGKSFRLIGDNVNFKIDESHQRKPKEKKRGNKKQNWFASAAIVQNIQFPHLSCVAPQRNIRAMPFKEFLPGKRDQDRMTEDYAKLVLRCLAKQVTFCRGLAPGVIRGPMSKEMTTVNQVVPLSLDPLNECSYIDDYQILRGYEDVVARTFANAGQSIRKVHIGGDQLTRERFSGAKTNMQGLNVPPEDKYEHLNPITFELFHACMNLLNVFFSMLYKDTHDVGTLNSARIRIQRSGIDKDVTKNYDAADDFATTYIEANVIEAALHWFNMEGLDSMPERNVPDGFAGQSKSGKQAALLTSLKEMITSLGILEPDVGQLVVNVQPTRQVTIRYPNGETAVVSLPFGEPKSLVGPDDHVRNYALQTLELGLLFLQLKDCIKMPDRERFLSVAKYLMVVYKANSLHSKYALECLRFLVHQFATLSEKKAHESFYGLFVNTHGKIDSHVPADLRMEFLVRQCKGLLRSMGSNKRKVASVRKRAKSLSGISTVCNAFEEETVRLVRAHRHVRPSSDKDRLAILEDLRQVRPFDMRLARAYNGFRLMKRSIRCQIQESKLQTWIHGHRATFATELGQ